MQARTPLMAVAVMLAVLAVSASPRRRFTCAFPTTSSLQSYAALARGFLPHTDEWAVVVFYRSPGCIPTEFNLLDFLDFQRPAPPCASCTSRAVNWVSLDDPYPAAQFFPGTGAVPVWFVRWPELQAAVADDVLTIGELAALPSLTVGSASFFHESVRNDTRGQRGGNETLVVSGMLTDGRSFFVQMTEKFRDGVHLFPHMTIQFR